MITPPPGPVGPPPGWPVQAPSGAPGYPPNLYRIHPSNGYPGYPSAPPWKPGVIPLRPLSLSDIFNGAVGYVRANPKAALGLTTAIVLITTTIGVASGLAITQVNGDASTVAGLIAGGAGALLATTLLSGMLTVIMARAVLGVPINVGEAWRRVRGRLPALIALTLLEIAGAAMMIATGAAVIYGIARAGSGAIAALIGIPLVLVLIAALTYLYAALALAPVAIVLENKGVLAAVRRSIALCRSRFWRILGFLMLAGLVARLVSGAIEVPFALAGQLMTAGTSSAPQTIAGTAIATVGQAIGGIITIPFVAGVVALLYVDARIRSEAFDFVLLNTQPVDADRVWLQQ